MYPSNTYPPFIKMATDGVFFQTLVDGRTSLRGNTFKYKDMIKSLGGTWSASEKVWIVPSATDLSFIKNQPPIPRAKPLPREEWTKEQWNTYKMSCNSLKSTEQCCKNAKVFFVYDQGPMCYRCERHGETYGSYTGD